MEDGEEESERNGVIAFYKATLNLRNTLKDFIKACQDSFSNHKSSPPYLDSRNIAVTRVFSDFQIKIPLPNGDSRMRILEIHASPIAKQGEIDYEKVVKLSEGFNGADMRNICTEAGMFAIRAERDFVVPEDFIKAVRKLGEAKKLESSAEYNAEFLKA